jgi:hypothetical protein
MKWVLNIIQFLIVYLSAFYLIKEENILGLGGIYANSTLMTGCSIAIAGILWKPYNRFSLFIIRKIKSIKFLHTTFFGYLDKKWKRLARVLSWFFYLISVFISFNIFRGGEPLLVIIGYPILITIISYTLKPFVVKDKS